MKINKRVALTMGQSAVGLAAVFAILIAANFIIRNARLRVDLTEDRLYTLSSGTRKLLAGLENPVTLKFFFSSSAQNLPASLKNFAREVEDLLQEYKLAARGKIIVEKYDPKPDSEAEEWAMRYGVQPNQVSMELSVFLGLVAVCGEQHGTAPVLDPRMENLLEYNISRLIARTSTPKLPVLGVMSSLPVLGREPMSMYGPQQGQMPPWISFKDLTEDYNVREIPPAATSIDPDIDTLIVVHPKQMPDAALYAIDQYILRGGRVLAFVDPLSLIDMAGSEMQMQQMFGADTSSDLNKLTEAWGIKMEPGKVLADLNASTSIRRTATDMEDSPTFLSLRNDRSRQNISRDDVATADLNFLLLPFSGAFSGQPAEGLSMTTLLVSSRESQLVESMEAQFGGDSIRRDFKSSMTRQPLAIKLHGTFPTAFPDGPPKPSDTNENEAAETEPADSEQGLKQSSAPGTVVLVADVDMLHDQFCVRELSFFGQRAFQPLSDNMYFFANLVEQLSGSAELVDIRSRGKVDRSFTRVQALQRQAQEKWLLQEQALEEKLNETKKRLDELQTAGKDQQDQRFILNPEQRAEIEEFKKTQIEVQQKLKEVRKNLREGIEKLGMQVKAVNLLAVPILISAAGVVFGMRRRKKQRK